MTKIAGGTVGSVKSIKEDLAARGAAWVKWIPKNGEMRVRFLTEPDEWYRYLEHFDNDKNVSYPCIGDDCPGCKVGDDPKRRYLVNALDTEQDTVVALQVPVSLAERLVNRMERKGTLTDRDYTLMRSGEGFNTVYDLEAEDVQKRNLKKYTPLDLEEVLLNAYNDAWAVSAAHVSSDVDDDDEDDEEDSEPLPAGGIATFAKADTGEEADADVDDEFWSLEELQAKPLGELKAIAKEFGVVTRPKWGREQIINAIIAVAAEDND